MPGRLVAAVLRCYPARWRSRHGDEAAELAELLIRDGTPARAVALSYLCGAARERLAGRRSRRVSAAAALLVAAGSLGAPLTLLSAGPAAGAAHVSRAPASRTGIRTARQGAQGTPGERCTARPDRASGARPAAARPGVPRAAISGTGRRHVQGC
jgi:hypothetical protein